MKKSIKSAVINDLPKATELLCGGARIGLQIHLPSVPLLTLRGAYMKGMTSTFSRGCRPRMSLLFSLTEAILASTLPHGVQPTFST